MRLICPGCDAAYEIPDRAIPLEGREVQCSACAHSWYQLPRAGPVPPRPPAPPPPDAGDEDGAELPHPVDEPLAPPRRRIDPDVIAVLREEAQREARARRQERAAPLETQPDLGLAAPPRRAAPPTPPAEGIRERLARIQAAEAARTGSGVPPWQRGEDEGESGMGRAMRTIPAPDEAEPARAAAPPAPPRDSGGRSLARRPSDRLPVALGPRELALIEERRQRAGFRLGFALTAGLAAAALALFLAAPAVIGKVPASAALLDPVVAGGSAVQDRLAEGLRASIAALTGAGAPPEG